MKSPKDQATIQIEITNACTHACSNCTRFCGHHKKPYFMDFDTFKRAVDSMEGYQGTIGVMGGEPTLHPEFERFTEYLNSRIPDKIKKNVNNYIYPQRDFMRALRNQELENIEPIDYTTGRREAVRGAGLWSAMVPKFKEHYEIIQDVYRKEVLNDHNNEMLHQPILITRKELGITDDEWIKLREKCWINRFWSASVTPKGCFFCEIAAALDRLFDGPGGWPIEPGWWMRDENDFEGQLRWCEFCGIPLQTYTRDAREEVDDVSPRMYKMLEKVESPKLKRGKVNKIRIEDYKISEESKVSVREMRGEFYAESYYSRFNQQKSVLYPDEFWLLTVIDSVSNDIIDAIAENSKLFSKSYVYLNNDKEKESLDECFKEDDKIIILNNIDVFGEALNIVLSNIDWKSYLFVVTNDVRISESGMNVLSNCVINPGTLHYVDFSKEINRGEEYVSNAKKLKCGVALLMNKNAMSLRKYGYDRLAKLTGVHELEKIWITKKVVELSPAMDYFPPNNIIKSNKRYAFFGVGHDAYLMANIVKDNKSFITYVVDSDENKWGSECFGCVVQSPKSLVSNKDLFDNIILASTLYYAEMKEILIGLGFTNQDMTMPCTW